MRILYGMARRFIGLAVMALAFLLFTSRVLAAGSADIVLVNQVRGDECCNPGSVDSTRTELELFEQYKVPATFVLRYDAVRTPAFSGAFKRTFRVPIELGVFLEVTPSLAKDAGVTYRAPEGLWFKAKYSYLLGYSVEERKKLIDTAFSAFEKTFGYLPRVTAGWMIDATSLQYLHEKYNVVAHELTREQWGIDSYTLYGGPVNVPYLPSKKWPIVPASSDDAALPVMVVRQTITDPLYTYGDLTSVYTSQPNDYEMGNLSTQYFRDLIKGVVKQLPKGFGVVGLENSMQPRHYEEFERQLVHLHDEESRKTVRMYTLGEYAELFMGSEKKNTVSVYFRNEDQKTAYWITAPGYRVRLIVNGTLVMVTDYRIYSDFLEDPYAEAQESSPNAYWIVPFALDGSRYRQPESRFGDAAFSLLKRLIPFQKDHSGDPVLNDFQSLPTGIVLPEKSRASMQVRYGGGSAHIIYTDRQGKPVSLDFSDTRWSIESESSQEIRLSAENQELQEIQNSPTLQWVATRSAALWTFEPKIIRAGSEETLLERYGDQLLPEGIQERPDMRNTVILYDAKNVILGRNPARIVVWLKDKNGSATVAQESVAVTGKDTPFFYANVGHPDSSTGQYMVDITQLERGTYTPLLHVDGETIELSPVRFITNCKDDLGGCLKHPADIFFFLYAKLQDLLHGR